MKRVAKLSLLAIVIALVGLGMYGVPAPPGVTSVGVPRVPWSPLLSGLGTARRMFDATSFSGWTADGRMIVRTLSWFQPKPHVVPEPGADPRVLPLPKRTGALRFNPDPSATYAVFARDEGGDEAFQLYRWDFHDDSHTRLTDGQSRYGLGPFSRDGSQLAYTSTERNGTDRDVYVMDPLHPASARSVLAKEGSWSVADWSSQGDLLLVQRYVSAEESHPYVLDIGSGELQPLVPLQPAASFSDLTFGPDDDTVFVVTNRGGEFAELMRVDRTTGTLSPATRPFGWDVLSVAVSLDRTRMAVVVNDDGFLRAHLVDPATGVRRELPLTSGSVSGLEFRPSGAEIGFTVAPLDGPAFVGSYEIEEREFVDWTTPPPLEGDPLPDSRLVRFPSFDGESIPAFVLDPPSDAPSPAPVVIQIHGGPEAQARAGTNAILDAVRRQTGAAIISPNVRGSSGYGKRYLGLDNGRLRENSVRDIGALLDWISTQPQYDRERVLVFGGSYGGYMVLASMIHFPERIRCGIDSVGISDFVTFLESTKSYRRDLRRVEYGDERDPQMREFLTSISPMTHAERIEGSLLVVQGANDPRVPASESQQMVERLRELGREVWYLEFPNEGHGVREPQNVAYTAVAGLTFARRCFDLD